MKDLTNIPERFHSLFTTDWNTGDESKMKIIQRSHMVDLFLEYNRWHIEQMIDSKKPIQSEYTGGFID
jgi:hypothetical protein